jgi:erythromycin esterase
MRFAASCLLLVACLGCTTSSARSEAPSVQPSSPPAASAPAAPAASEAPSRLTGKVLRAEGAPVAGARVGLVPHVSHWDLRTSAPVALVESGADGAFQMGPLAPGEYSVGVAAPDGSVVFSAAVFVRKGESPAPVELRLTEAPSTLEGTVRDEAGRPLADAEVRFIKPAIPYDDVAFLPRGPEGRYRVKLTPGQYTVSASARGFTPMMKQVTVASGQQTFDLTLETRPDAAMRQAATAWMKQTAVPLQTVEAGQGFADLQPLKKVLQDTRVVALGEATHGTREFFQLKHRMLEFLVTELGYTVFAIEANLPEAHAVNDYVLTGKGDPAEALAGLYFWTWNTEEVLELIRWMRRYNEDPAHPKKLKFYGFDMQTPRLAAETVGDYLAKVDAPFSKGVQERLAPLTDMRLQAFRGMSADDKRALATFVQQVASRFDERRRQYVRASDARRWALMRQNVAVLRQFLEMQVADDYTLRDRFMAENLRWVLAHEGPDTRAVVWAHNGHVARGEDEWLQWPMGRHLGAALGPQLYVYGFAFHQGGFQAVNMSQAPAKERRGVVEFTVPPAPEHTLEAALAATGLPRLALDLRAVPRSGPIYEWWRRAHETRDIGAIYSDEGYPLATVHPLSHYDGLLFVERTTRARPNPRREPPRPAPAATTAP